MDGVTRERPLYLWMIAASPVVWAAHFVLSYAAAAVWCAKVAGAFGSLLPVRIGVGVLTAAALAGIVAIGLDGWRRHRHGGGAVPHDDDSPEDRHRFLGAATALLSALSAVGTVFVALTVVFVGDCR